MDPVEAIISNVGDFFYQAQIALVTEKAVLFDKSESHQMVFSQPMIKLMEDVHSKVVNSVTSSGLCEIQKAYFVFMADHVRYTLNEVLSSMGRSFSPPDKPPDTRYVTFSETRELRIYNEDNSDDEYTDVTEDIDTIMGKYLQNNITSVQRFLNKHYAHMTDVADGLTECNGLGELLLTLWQNEVTCDVEFHQLEKLNEGDAYLPDKFFHFEGECYMCDGYRLHKCKDHFTNRFAIYLEHHVATCGIEMTEARDIYRHIFKQDMTNLY